jgi:hypothetical protein
MNRFRTTALAFLVGGFTTGMCACAALKDLPDTAFLGTCAVIAAVTWVMILAAELADARLTADYILDQPPPRRDDATTIDSSASTALLQ